MAGLTQGLVLLVAGAMIGRCTAPAQQTESPITSSTTSSVSTARGNGSDTLNITGEFTDEDGVAWPFVAQSALVFPGHLGLEVYIYDSGLDCASARQAYLNDFGIHFELSLSDNPAAVEQLPLNRPLPGATGTIVQQTGDSSVASFSVEPVEAVLTRVDTSPGGIWRGHLTADLSEAGDPGSVAFSIRGTFAARWCGS
jgi:hypothetical protein